MIASKPDSESAVNLFETVVRLFSILLHFSMYEKDGYRNLQHFHSSLLLLAEKVTDLLCMRCVDSTVVCVGYR
jgi:hypothetical protein